MPLVVLPTKEDSKQLNQTLLRENTKPGDGPIQSQVAQARQQLIRGFSAQESGAQSFGGCDDRFNALVSVTAGVLRRFTEALVGGDQVIPDQLEIGDSIRSEDKRPSRLSHGRRAARRVRSSSAEMKGPRARP